MCHRFCQRWRPSATPTQKKTAEKSNVVHQRSDRQFGKRCVHLFVIRTLFQSSVCSWIYGIYSVTLYINICVSENFNLYLTRLYSMFRIRTDSLSGCICKRKTSWKNRVAGSQNTGKRLYLHYNYSVSSLLYCIMLLLYSAYTNMNLGMKKIYEENSRNFFPLWN